MYPTSMGYHDTMDNTEHLTQEALASNKPVTDRTSLVGSCCRSEREGCDQPEKAVASMRQSHSSAP